jgi:tellurite resistance protein TehA-like permease
MAPYIIIAGFVPLMCGFFVGEKSGSPEKEVLNVFASFATIISGLILLNRLYIHLDIPASFIFLTTPALVITASLYLSPGTKEKELNIFAFVLAILGYFITFFVLLDRIYPAPVGIYPFHTQESLIGITSAVIFYGLAKKQRE